MQITTIRWYGSPSSESSSALVVSWWMLLLGNPRRRPLLPRPFTTWSPAPKSRVKGRDLALGLAMTSSLTSSLSALSSTARLSWSVSAAVTSRDVTYRIDHRHSDVKSLHNYQRKFYMYLCSKLIFYTTYIFRIFPSLRINKRAPFCNLFIERSS